MVHVKLEYSEKQGLFHYSELGERHQHIVGWETVCEKISLDQADEFTEEIYTDMDKEEKVITKVNNKLIVKTKVKTNPTHDEIIKKFEGFLSTSPN